MKKKNEIPRRPERSTGFGTSALFLAIMAGLLILVGLYLLIVSPSGLLTHSDMGVLLLVSGFIAVLVLGVMPVNRPHATRERRCVNCGAKIFSGYLCSDCQDKLDQL